ncbi:hypothetical protein ABH945_005960 [Paraburkholderia sp. GAS333]|uniref:hypothetical protein n=1 Tax=Paraburkholderia sp. GAS333 TaxID=3156279 RepID=UPI003D263546
MIEEKDLTEIRTSILIGVTVSVGSLTLLFSSGAHLLIQCPFECDYLGHISVGHGEKLATGPLLFECLNHVVENTEFDANLMLTVSFDGGRRVKIEPEASGLESYVLTTRFGICPVIASP